MLDTKHIHIPESNENILIIVLTQDSADNFKTLVNRALNTWADAPAELKEFGDILLEGKPLQNYKVQEV